MAIAYQHIEPINPHSYYGVIYDEDYIKDTFPNEVKTRLLDSEGTDELVNGLSKAEFGSDFLYNILSLDDSFEEHPDWRIGEAFAELVLEEDYGVRFHYNELRDARNPRGNKTGADIVGFVEMEGKTVFVFGEVKSSNDTRRPPQVLYGKTGLINQLEGLIEKPTKRGELIRYLGFKVIDKDDTSPFREDFISALRAYKEDSSSFFLFGVLIRDVDPEERDLRARYLGLVGNIEQSTGLNLSALYLPFSMESWNEILNNGGSSHD